LNKLSAGIKQVAVTSLISGLLLATMLHWQALWSPVWLRWSQLLPQAPLLLLMVALLLSSQFNRSRVALLCVVWSGLWLSWQFTLPWQAWLNDQQSWLLLFVGYLLVGISFLQDRALLSLHSLFRLCIAGMLGLVCYCWLTYMPNMAQSPIFAQLPEFIQRYYLVELPLLLAALVILLRSCWQPTSIVLTVALSFVLWCLLQLQWLDLPRSAVVVLLATYYLLVVMFDSYLLAYRDELTALPTRRALNNLALSLVRNYSLAMLDIDHFKKFNDNYGHDIGDQVLKLVATQLKKVKSGGRVFRYGGEEFTVVFPGKTLTQAKPELEKLRQAIADYAMVIRQPVRQNKQARGKRIVTQEKTVTVTISIGVAEKRKGLDFNQVLKSADQALYRAKEQGRNKVSE
jgi:diguanylate cyclase (GGDEF)-like protein